MPAPLLLPNFGAEEGTEGLARVAPLSLAMARLWRALFQEDATFVDGTAPDEALALPSPLAARRGQPLMDHDGVGLVAWLNTKHAARLAAERRLPLHGASPEIVRLVHDKAFALEAIREAGLEGCPEATILEPEELRDPEDALRSVRRMVDRWPTACQERFTLKPRLGCSGRGRVPCSLEHLDNEELRGALPRLVKRGGAIVEPIRSRTKDLSAVLWVSAPDDVRLLGTLEQHVSVSGSYFGHRGILSAGGEIHAASPFREELMDSSRRMGRSAAERGYRGACGVDAFTYREGDRERFRAGVEFNARYTLGAIVLDVVRRCREHLRKAGVWSDSEEIAFAFFLQEPPSGWPTSTEIANAEAHFVPLWLPGDTINPGVLMARSDKILDDLANGNSQRAEPS
ncbi:hypothetical protein Pan216_30930 [Planctomycetes bacterium Pan216]|uniref:ATP-grasp domain-containing protein n=1 Tax=Kolteria novifilia TaxID=2527975 RepID=A0A518B5I8_9BACT|nr:hypothetical protein Pan216_30930 [Planctomycetes bacterium Pan216]